MNGKPQLLVYNDDVNMLGENLQTVRENAEIFIKASKNIDLEVNYENTKYMITSRHQNIVRNQITVIENLPFENEVRFKYLGVTVTNTNDIREETKRKITWEIHVILHRRIFYRPAYFPRNRILIHIGLLYYQLYCLIVKLGLSC